MNPAEMAKRLKGLQTVETVSSILGVERRTAINYISRLRKLGYASTGRGKGKIRLYEIGDVPVRKRGEDFYDFLNARSKIKIAKPYEYIIYHKLTPEECIVRAIGTRDFRTVLSALSLFRLVSSWPDLYRFAKEAGELKSVGALYDLARKHVRVRRMDGRIRNRMLDGRQASKYIIPGMKSRDFPEIEKAWSVHLPFNRSDMERLNE